jgi:hypothetical protein
VAGLEQHDLRVLGRVRLVVDAPRYDVHVARAEYHLTVVQADRQLAVEHEEELVGVGVLVPDELPLDLTSRTS